MMFRAEMFRGSSIDYRERDFTLLRIYSHPDLPVATVILLQTLNFFVLLSRLLDVSDFP